MIALIMIGSLYLYFALNKADSAGFYDVKYAVEYSPDSTFHYISEWYWFYDRVRDKYYLKPSQVDARHWIGKGPGSYGSQRQRFARIKGIINDSVIYLTKAIEFRGCILTVPRLDPEIFNVKGKTKFKY